MNRFLQLDYCSCLYSMGVYAILLTLSLTSRYIVVFFSCTVYSVGSVGIRPYRVLICGH